MKQITIDYDTYKKELRDKIDSTEDYIFYKIGTLLFGNKYWEIERVSRQHVILEKIEALLERDELRAKDGGKQCPK